MRERARVIFLLAWLMPVCAHAQDAPSREYQVKAACILNFAHFVEWPGGAVDTPLVIGVLGDDPFKGALEQIVAGKSVGKRKLVVRKFATAGDVKDVHILFVPADQQQHLGAIREKSNAGVLTVGEAEGFTTGGGVIRFFLEEGKIRFEINVRAAESAKLKISSRLLKLARVVG